MIIKISEKAAQDIETIYLYGFIHFGEAQADEYAAIFKDRIDILSQYPEIGRLDSRINPAVRRFDIESHVVFYDVFQDHILIVRILHKATNFIQHLID